MKKIVFTTLAVLAVVASITTAVVLKKRKSCS